MEYFERVSPEISDQALYLEHLARYIFAGERLTAGMRVLDAACGAGYGASYLGELGASIVGVDINAEAVSEARKRYPDISFLTMDCARLTFEDASFDGVVAFEMIEHIPDYTACLGEIWRVLRSGGLLILSTPNVSENRKGSSCNPYHCHELSKEDLQKALLGESFHSCEFHGQGLSAKGREAAYGSERKRRWARWDPLGLRRLLPQSFYSRLLFRMGFATRDKLQVEDFPIGPWSEDSLYTIVIAKKQGGTP